MDLFASARERRLWLWALAVLVAIVATLGLAGTAAGDQENLDLLATIFVAALLLAAAAIVVIALWARPSGVEIGVGLGIAAVYVMVIQRTALAVERSHLFEYGVLAVFIHEALAERARHRPRVRIPALMAIVTSSAIGVLDETVQLALPTRVFDWYDMGFNALAAVMAVTASLALAWARRRSQRRYGI